MKKPSTKSPYWILKLLSIIISAGLPLLVIFNKFPLWVETHGTIRSVGTGGIIAAIVLLVVFRDQVWGYIKQRYKLGHAPKITGWVVGLIIIYSLMFIVKFLYDLSQVMWAGLIGSALGAVLTLAGEFFFNEVKEETK